MEQIADRWDSSDSIMDYSDTDLQYMRDYSTRVYDPDFEIHRLAETVRREYDLENWSDTLDTALRVELAAAIDDCIVLDRQQFDVAYMIPPKGWVAQQQYDSQDIELVPEVEIMTDDEDSDVGSEHPRDPFISYSAPTECRYIMEKIIEEGIYDLKKEVVVAGLKRMVGQL